jgi:xanthine/uracil permease
MNRAVWVGGWVSLGLVIGAPVMMVLANTFGAGDERMVNRDFVGPSSIVLAVGFVLSMVALLRRWNPPKRLRIPAIVAVCLATPAFVALITAGTYAYEMECGGG